MKKLILTIVIVLVIVGLYIGGTVGIKSIRSNVAQGAGEKFIQKLYVEYTIAGGSCQGEDTDDDSYVSCDFRIRNAASAERVIHLQCPIISKRITGSTCKEARAVVSQ